MKLYTPVSRKNVREDRVAICPNFGCEYMKRVKPLKLRFLGFGKQPKCKKHRIPLVYVEERIVDFVDAALACLFDKAGLPPHGLIESIKKRFPDEINSYIEGWIYCITIGRGVSIISRYMDTVSNAYLKQLTKKQIKALKKSKNINPNIVNKAIKDGMDEIAVQYERILKHLRIYSEIFNDQQKLQPLSKALRNFLEEWQRKMLKHNQILNSTEVKRSMTLLEIKTNYDQILNVGTCRCLLGFKFESNELKKTGLRAFDRFSAYHDFYIEGLTTKFTKSDISALYSENILINTLKNSPKECSDNMNEDGISEIENKLKKIDWSKVSNCWQVKFRKNQYSNYKIIELDPNKECSQRNPLYKHKKWVERVYHDKSFDMTDEKLANLCNITKRTANYWRRYKHGIIGKEEWGKGRWIDNRSGRIYVRIPDDYNHPQLKKDSSRKKTYRPEHIFIMEGYLAKHPELDISKKYLIRGKYLKIECEVHHINFDPQDNKIENLWIYANKKAHSKGEKSIRKVFTELIMLGYILFSNGKYFLNQNIDFNSFSNPVLKGFKNFQQISYQNINLNDIKEEIKNIKWYEISNDWRVIKRFNQFKNIIIELNPYKDCSEENPLYMHKHWFSRIYNDPNLNLSDSKMGKICEISKDKARYWREKIHQIEGKKEWGKNKIIDKSDSRIWIRVPKSYSNPVVNKKDTHRRLMLEHRYIMEKHLSAHPEWDISKRTLEKGKYLKSDCEVHHINLNYQDNRLENLWVFETNDEHQETSRSLYALVGGLMELELIQFENGFYRLNYQEIVKF